MLLRVSSVSVWSVSVLTQWREQMVSLCFFPVVKVRHSKPSVPLLYFPVKLPSLS